MRHHNRPPRRGFTLMDVILALAVSLVLLAAVYTAFFVLIRQTEDGRRVVNHSNVARAIFTRINNDVSCQLAPLDPRLVNLPEDEFIVPEDEAAVEEGGDTTTAPPAETTPTDGQTTSDSGDTGEGGEEEPIPVPPSLFNLGVQGDEQQLVLFVNQLPNRRAGLSVDPAAFMGQSGLRRIAYWVVDGPNGPAGLARQVLDVPTSDETMLSVPRDAEDPLQYVFAKEVVSVQFEYFDGVAWQLSWNGMVAQTVNGNNLPVGPPIAIAVNLEISPDPRNPDAKTRFYRHVISLPTANGPVDLGESGAGLLTEQP